MLHRTIMIMAGGTGGHIYPALAVADYLSEKGLNVLWLGTQKGLEAKIVPEHGYSLFFLEVSGVRGKGLMKKIMAPWVICKAIAQSLSIIKKQKPNVILGMGGFASGPGGIAAYLLGIPLCIHEQNSISGLTNRLLKPFAICVMQAFPSAFKSSSKIITTGNPVRQEILSIQKKQNTVNTDEQAINLLIIGGSLGAKKLNETVPAALNRLNGSIRLNVRHQSGEKHQAITQQYYSDFDIEAVVEPFINDMASAYEWADVIICRAGAMTIAEISIVGIPAVLIPYPYAVDDHQTTNAQYLADKGLATLIQESALTEESLVSAIKELCRSKDHLYQLSQSIRALGKPNATEIVAEKCLEVIRD